MDRQSLALLPTFLTTNFCFLCEEKILNVDQYLSHYGLDDLQGQKHANDESYAHALSYQSVVKDILRWNLYDEPIEEPGYYYCYVCRLRFTSKKKMHRHAFTFPHYQLAALKEMLWQQGITHEIFVLRGPSKKRAYIYCMLCFVDLNDKHQLWKHIGTNRHWCKLEMWRFSLCQKEVQGAEIMFAKDELSKQKKHQKDNLLHEIDEGPSSVKDEQPSHEEVFLQLNKLVDTVTDSRELPLKAIFNRLKLFKKEVDQMTGESESHGDCEVDALQSQSTDGASNSKNEKPTSLVLDPTPKTKISPFPTSQLFEKRL